MRVVSCRSREASLILVSIRVSARTNYCCSCFRIRIRREQIKSIPGLGENLQGAP